MAMSSGMLSFDATPPSGIFKPESRSASAAIFPHSPSVTLNPGPLYARLGAIVAPALFWAYEVPLLDAKFERTALYRVIKLEEQLAARYHTTELKIRVEGHLNDSEVKEGLMVAVRCDHRSEHWMRGRVISVYANDRGQFARIFLVDYGKYVDSVSVRVNVRQLPKIMKLCPKPLAFQLVLAGIRPLSYEMNYGLGLRTLCEVVSQEWSEKALEDIRDVVSQSQTNLVEVTDWQKDFRGRLHGTVKLFSHERETFLAKFLVDNQYAAYNEQIFYSDIRAKPEFSVEPRALSICGGGPSTGPSRNHTMESLFDSLEISSSADPDFSTSTSVSDTALIEVKKVGTNWTSLPARIIPKSVDTSFADSNDGKTEMTPFERLRARQRLANASIWDRYRDSSDALNTSSMSTSSTGSRKIVVVPAGVDTGKFLEQQLKRITNDGIGPKKLSQLFD